MIEPCRGGGPSASQAVRAERDEMALAQPLHEARVRDEPRKAKEHGRRKAVHEHQPFGLEDFRVHVDARGQQEVLRIRPVLDEGVAIGVVDPGDGERAALDLLA